MAAAQINHPNVVAIFDAEERAGGAYVAMELVDGIGLDRYLEKRGRLDWREVAPLAAAIAGLLADRGRAAALAAAGRAEFERDHAERPVIARWREFLRAVAPMPVTA